MALAINKKYALKRMGVFALILCCSCSNATLENAYNEVDGVQGELKQEELDAVSLNDIKEMNAKEKQLIGIWHEAPSISAGYGDLFYFYPDNKFKFIYSRYDEAKQELEVSGIWEVIEDNLILEIKQKTVIEGEEIALPSPSAISKYHIVNGEEVVNKLSIPTNIIYTLSDITQAADSLYEYKVFINEVPYWQLSKNPEDDWYIQNEQENYLEYETSGIDVFGK